MNKFYFGLFSTLTIFGLIVFFYSLYALSLHKKELEAFPPLTTAELYELSELLDPGWMSNPDNALPENLPTTLIGLPAPRRFKVGAWEKIELHFDSTVHALLNGYWIAGFPRIMKPSPMNLGFKQRSLGNRKVAANYFWVSIDWTSTQAPSECKWTLSELARLEDDPERAALLLQISCQGTFSYPDQPVYRFLDAYYFCTETGNHYLANYYLERLYTEFPREVEQFPAPDSIPARPSAK